MMSSDRQPLVAANWKMNGTLDTIRPLMGKLVEGIRADVKAEIVICPPFVYLAEVASLLGKSGMVLGAQNLARHDSGAYTGEISAAMLLDYQCRYVIVGHSERRTLYGETDVLVAEKFAQANKAGLTPILCVGEYLEEREAGDTDNVIARQLDAVITKCSIESFDQAVIAYEPVWAIGTGRAATPEQAQEVHAFIRLRLARHDERIADNVRILYGGSVKATNAEELFTMADIDGGLIGGASLDANDFLTICRAA
jgi:triosephosphate isomerase (TIM)